MSLESGSTLQEKGFTLVEVLLALGLLSIMTLLAWQGLNGMQQAANGTDQHERAVHRLDVTLKQWQFDLDQTIQTGLTRAMDFDGLRLIVTRKAPATPDLSALSDGVVVVAWKIGQSSTAASEPMQPHLQRWSSQPVRTAAALLQEKQNAERWARTPLAQDAAQSTTLVPVKAWQVFYFRDTAWSNAQSSAGQSTSPDINPGPNPNANPNSSSSPGRADNPNEPLPEGVRWVLTLPDNGLATGPSGGGGAALTGTLTVDWIAPTVGATR